MMLRSGQGGDLLLVAELSLGEGSDSVARARVSDRGGFRVSVCREGRLAMCGIRIVRYSDGCSY